MTKKATKFTDDEVKKINDLRIEVSQVFTQLGQLSIERKSRLNQLDVESDKLINRHAELVEIEQQLFQELNGKYGDGNYDPETGIFTPVVNEDPSPTLEPTSTK